VKEILIRSGRPPHLPMSPEASLARFGWGVFGSNAGNTLFLSSVFRALNTADSPAVVDGLYPERGLADIEAAAGQINERFSAWVIPLANAFRPGFEHSLNNLTRLIRRLTIPCVVVGVGIQSGLDSPEVGDARTVEATKKFVTAVLNRSGLVGVRGETTRDWLIGLGFPAESITVIGCPSLFDNAGDLQVIRRVERIEPEHPLAVNITMSKPPVAASYFTRMCQTYPDLVYVAQQVEELELLLWGTPWTKKYPQLPTHRQHPLYTQDRIRFFLDPARWRDFMAGRYFAFGSRLHGNIAAIAAGTPALMIAHDSRTLEVADYHAIPRLTLADRPGTADIDVFYQQADYAEFNRRHLGLFQHYLSFLEANGLRHIHQPGQANPAYDAVLAGAAYPEPVAVVEAHLDPAGRELFRKLAWLRGGRAADQQRAATGYDFGWLPGA
jgi:hypothetical protein